MGIFFLAVMLWGHGGGVVQTPVADPSIIDYFGAMHVGTAAKATHARR
jgi:hypothetical protein